ncbi:hypothetical protein [Paenibacillus mendelii]|uniref:Uncharacterized protein n=1 Tax=Paenibacillus mendelii TaxID=206163 RepID=A0ABV6J7J5_9BACL|nr:hypothetical protein [Paenibacillus mendelii]MCQ6562197.1 hypothetical protein [Paenibacillus mendelii]
MGVALNISPFDYLNRLRIEEAVELLGGIALPIIRFTGILNILEKI